VMARHGVEDQRKEPARGKFSHNPLVVTVIPALITGLLGAFGAYLAARAGHLPGIPAPAVTVTVTQPATGTGTPSVSTPSPVYFQDPILISGSPGLDFDINPPAAGPDAVSISYNTFSLAAGSSTGGLAVWTNDGTPKAADCKIWVSTQQVSSVYQPAAGMKICFKTNQGRIGLLQVMPGTSENQFKATATVWGT
jgi:hypothetical protein